MHTLACGVTVADPGDPPGSLITRPRQIEFAGLLMGSGTPIRWKTLNGWDGPPPVDLSDTPSPAGHGDIPGRGLFQSRIATLEFFTEADTVDAMEELLQVLQDRLLYSDVEQPLYVRDGARTLWSPARVVQADVPMDKLRTIGRTDQAVQWKCTPLRFSPETRRVTLRPGMVTSTGLTYPLTYPLEYGQIAETVTTGTLANGGNTAAPSRVTFTGPTGSSYGVNLDGVGLMVFDLPLAAGETLTVDTRSGTVVLNGSAGRDTALTDGSVVPEDWQIPKGSTPVELVTTVGTSDATRVDIEWADTSR